jgi:hypothetical protein
MYRSSKVVKHHCAAIAALAVSLMGSALVPSLKADEWDKRTNITINRSIDVQGTVLPAGSYVMKVLSSPADRHTVQIFNADDNHIVATILAIPASRAASTDETEFKFYEVAEGQTPALRTWFYPGDNAGFEFRFVQIDAATQSARHTNATASHAAGD